MDTVQECVISTWPYDNLLGGFEPWWRYQMETFSALLALCAGNSLVTVEFPSQRPVTQSFEDFFDLRLNKLLSKQSWAWWFETPPRTLWCHCISKCLPISFRFAPLALLQSFHGHSAREVTVKDMGKYQSKPNLTTQWLVLSHQTMWSKITV